jgi:hypothetical protein
MHRRRKRRFPFAAYAALIFNAAIVMTPFIAARAALTAYGEKDPSFETTRASIEATRVAMDNRFKKLATSTGEPARDAWAGYVREAIEADRDAEARGFLLAAPAMLQSEDAASIRERIRVSDAGDEDAVIEAAMAYLPDDVQSAYARESTSVLAMFRNAADASTVATAGAAEAETAAETEAGAEQEYELNVLGDWPDLSLQAARWVRQEEVDEFALSLSGVGRLLTDRAAREGASIALMAWRAEELTPEFRGYLERRLFAAAPPDGLKRNLQVGLENEYRLAGDGGAAVRKAFESSIRTNSLQVDLLSQDLKVIREIADETSVYSAVAILSQVKNGADLRRARLVARAGGDKAVALARNDGPRLLDNARTVVKWTMGLMSQVAGLVACGALLLLLACNVFWRSVTRNAPKLDSAVYGRMLASEA